MPSNRTPLRPLPSSALSLPSPPPRRPTPLCAASSAATRLPSSAASPAATTAVPRSVLWGSRRDGLRAVAERVAAQPYPNPRPPEAEALTRLLEEAW
ncbi:hypothetical protein ACWGJT_28610 [Streptomyces xantholiticus]